MRSFDEAVSARKIDFFIASKRLLSLSGKRLEVWKTPDDNIAVCYPDAEIKGDGVLIAKYGKGPTFEDACEDYISKISGKTLVFNAGTSSRREITVL